MSQTDVARKLRPDLAQGFHELVDRAKPTPDGGLPHAPRLADSLIQDAVRNRASDIHIEPHSAQTKIRFRIDGRVWDVAALPREAAQLLINQFKAMAGLDPIIRFTPRDAHASSQAEGRAVDLRLSLTPCQSGETLALRLLDARRLERTMDDLGLTEKNLLRLEGWVENINGMFLAAGPTGSGKTTTIYSLLHELKFAGRIILSLEDPVEYQIDGITQVPLDEKHHFNFADGVKAMLRLDPDYLMLGEIRDGASAHAAINAAISGRVLLSTIHSRDAVGTLTALRNWGLGDHEIAETLSVVVAQRLVRKLCPHCRRPSEPDAVAIAWLRSMNIGVPPVLWEAAGCERCQYLGYFGRTGVFEFWELDASDYDLIFAHATERAMREQLSRRNHESLGEDGVEKVRKGMTSLDEVRKMTGGLPISNRAEN